MTDSDKDMTQRFVEEFKIAVAPLILRIKQTDQSDPSKVNDLRSSVKTDLQSVIDNLERKLKDGCMDAKTWIEAMVKLPTKNSENDLNAYVFLMEILLKIEIDRLNDRGKNNV